MPSPACCLQPYRAHACRNVYSFPRKSEATIHVRLSLRLPLPATITFELSLGLDEAGRVPFLSSQTAATIHVRLSLRLPLPATITFELSLGLDEAGRVPTSFDLIRFADENAIGLRYLGNLDAVEGTAIPVEQHAHAILKESTGLSLLEILPVLFAKDRDRQVGTKTSGNDGILVRGTDLVHQAEERLVFVGRRIADASGLGKSGNDEIVPKRVHLIPTVVHDGPEVVPNLTGALLVDVLLVQGIGRALVLEGVALEKVSDGLKVGVLSAGAQEGSVVDLGQTAGILVLGHGAVGA